ncbi:MAG: IS4 family transposase [Bacteroidia bacterium]
MQHHKSNTILSELSNYQENSSAIYNTIKQVLSGLELRGIKSHFQNSKSRGVDAFDLFKILLIMPFWGIENVRHLFNMELSKYLDSKKDTFYDLLRNDKMNWRGVMQSFVRQFLKAISLNTDATCDQESEPKCLIIDDTILKKTGKIMELMGKVFDHTTHTYTLGYKLLALCFWDGKTTLPIDFSLHCEPGKKGNRGMSTKELDAQYSKQRDDKSKNADRIKEVTESKIDVAIKMIKDALKLPIEPKYILADSWFICSKFISKLSQQSKSKKKVLNVIGMMKTNRKLQVGNKTIMANKVPEVKQNQIQYSRKFKSHYIKKKVVYDGINIVAYWVRPKGQHDWKLIVSTDLNVNFIKVMEIYTIRWSIEVFFKDSKQHLGLNKCQSIDLNAHLASVTICFINYGLLSVQKRINNYETIGGIFRNLQNEIFESNLVNRIWELFCSILNNVMLEIIGDWEIFMEKCIANQERFMTMIAEMAKLFKPKQLT